MRMKPARLIPLVLAMVWTTGCTGTSPEASLTAVPSAAPVRITPALPTPCLPSPTTQVRHTATVTEKPGTVTATTPRSASPTPSVTQGPDAWKDLPVIPSVSQTAREIYRRGLAMGNNPRAFSKVGDCQNVLSMFLTIFDDPDRYCLGDYESVRATIDYFTGSFSRQSVSVRGGFHAASILSPFWADPEFCESGESPLACELRLHRPSIAIISLEAWWEGAPENYERYLRQIVEYTISQGVLPILATKADNVEGDYRINAAVARIAQDFDVPLWNFCAAVQPLPGHGLLADGFHLTFDLNYFDDPIRMKAAWPWRNLTALQTLDGVRRSAEDLGDPGSFAPARTD